MSKLDDLIAELCPNGVEYKELGEILKNNNAKNSISKKDYKDVGNIPIIDQSQSYISGYTDDISAIPLALPSIIFGDHTRIVKYSDFKFAQGDSGTKVFIPVDDTLNTKYIYYTFCNLEIPSRGYNRHWSIVKQIKIPIPPLSIQEEIVRILDKFTSLEAELEAELEARRQQYEYYTINLLTFDENTEFARVGDYCSIEKGKTPIQKAVAGEYPLVATTEELQMSNTYQFDCQAVCVPLISSRGHGVASISRIYFQEGKFALGNILCAIIPNNYKIINAKFLRYYLFFKKDILLVPLMRGGANVSLNIESLKKVKIPILPIEEQLRIVAILDRFDALVNDISQGIPAEIEARRKQYEYYRDKLLTFKEVV
jgi:type I restriction enzyme S subunit